MTDEARRIVALAQSEAIRCRASEVGAEHLLLALIQDGRSEAADMVRELGVNLERVRQEIEWKLAPGPGFSGNPPYSAQAQRLVQAATSMDLLLGILNEPSGIAFDVLKKLGVTLEALDSGDR